MSLINNANITDTTIEITSDPTFGTLVDNADGTVTYTPEGDQAVDSFWYRVMEGGRWSKEFKFTIFVTIVNEFNEEELGIYAKSDEAILTPYKYGNTSQNVCMRRKGYPTIGDDIGWNSRYPSTGHFNDDLGDYHWVNYWLDRKGSRLYYLFPLQKEVKVLHLGDKYQRENRGRIFELFLQALGV